MKCEDTVIKGQKKLRKGYTTGTCAAAAAKAAAWMVLSGEEIREVKLTVPAKVTLFLEVEEIRREKDVVFCAVRKAPEMTRMLPMGFSSALKCEKRLRAMQSCGKCRFA